MRHEDAGEGPEARIAELERELRESEARFAALLERSGDGIFMVDLDGRFAFVNDFVAESSGFPKQAFVGLRFVELIRSEDRALTQRNFERAAAGERVPPWELAYATAAGELMWVEVSAAPVVAGGVVTGVLGMSRNIHARKAMEAALRENEEKYRTLIETLPHVVGILQDGELVFINETAQRWFGFDPVKENQPVEQFLAPSQRVRVMGMMRRRADGEPIPRHYRTTLVRADGEEFPVEIFVHPITYRGRAALQAVAIDVSEREALEQQLQQVQKMEALGTLAGGVAHDFNNLLTAILASVALIKRQSALDEQAYDAADTIELAARRAGSLTSQLIGFARKSSPERNPVDLHCVIDEVCCILSRTLDSRIRIVKRLEAGPGAWAFGDAGQLQQVVMNLVVNARDAMPDGGEVAVETACVALDDRSLLESFEIAAGPYLLLRVSDTGVGIPDDVFEHLFEPFYTTKPDGKGSGMGLAVVYGIVRGHHGAIRVDSTPDGSSFEIYLPMAPEGAVVDSDRPPVAETGPGTILLVDDEDLVRQSATAVLRSLGYQVVACRDGAEAVELYRSCADRIDVALIDVSMPGMNGWECLLQLRRINPGLRAIMSSGYGCAAPPVFESDGSVTFLSKPYVADDLSRTVAGALGDWEETTPVPPS